MLYFIYINLSVVFNIIKRNPKRGNETNLKILNKSSKNNQLLLDAKSRAYYLNKLLSLAFGVDENLPLNSTSFILVFKYYLNNHYNNTFY